MFGITPFGMFHTVIALIAVAAGLTAVTRYREIGLTTVSGRIYVGLTIFTCVTGLFIFRHGTFGVPHALAILTLLVLAVAITAEKRVIFGRLSRQIAVVAYSATLFFHMIPGFTETATRIPEGAPLATGPEDPGLRAAVGAAFLVFLVGAALQVRRIRRETPAAVRGSASA
jgi:uncharacterized membrane protein